MTSRRSWHPSRPSQDKDDEQDVIDTTAIEPSHLTENMQEGQEIVLNEGEYALFRFKGSPEALQEFILTLYTTCLPMLKLTRRKGQDIERFHPMRKVMGSEPPKELDCDYLIPIRR